MFDEQFQTDRPQIFRHPTSTDRSEEGKVGGKADSTMTTPSHRRRRRSRRHTENIAYAGTMAPPTMCSRVGAAAVALLLLSSSSRAGVHGFTSSAQSSSRPHHVFDHIDHPHKDKYGINRQQHFLPTCEGRSRIDRRLYGGSHSSILRSLAAARANTADEGREPNSRNSSSNDSDDTSRGDNSDTRKEKNGASRRASASISASSSPSRRKVTPRTRRSATTANRGVSKLTSGRPKTSNTKKNGTSKKTISSDSVKPSGSRYNRAGRPTTARTRTTETWYQREALLNHRLLTKVEELDLGRQIHQANGVRERLKNCATERRNERIEQGLWKELRYEEMEWINAERLETPRSNGQDAAPRNGFNGEELDGYELNEQLERELEGNEQLMDDDADVPSDISGGNQFLPSDEELFQLGMASSFTTSGSDQMSLRGGSRIGSVSGSEINGISSTPSSSLNDDEEMLLSEESGFTILERESQAAARSAQSYVAVAEGSRFAQDAVEQDLAEVRDDDVVWILDGVEEKGIGSDQKGNEKTNIGKDDVRSILQAGAEARQFLMRSNLRLVVSISKKWMQGSPARGEVASLRELYAGGWDRPSLDDVIQEGIVGLSRAVDKYDFTRGNRFSTYATWWITNYVRIAFRTATTGPLRIPSQLYDIKNRYRKLIAQLQQQDEPIPSAEDLAAMLKVNVNRLRMALTVTESLLSIDQPVASTGFSKGSGAGELGLTNGDVFLSDTLVCQEASPEELVEISILRQCLENALAAELSPHERDVIRLRLGLDDGQTRTAKQVAEVCGGVIKASDVRRAEQRAFKKLSSPTSLTVYNLKDYLFMIGIEGEIDQNYEFQALSRSRRR